MVGSGHLFHIVASAPTWCPHSVGFHGTCTKGSLATLAIQTCEMVMSLTKLGPKNPTF